MPDLYVIAGPNGAGKSTYSAGLIAPGVEIFDGDKELARLEKEYPDISPGHLQTVVLEDLFEEKKAAAIKEGKHFAYETNFSSPTAMHSPQEFRKAGYTIKMIFIGLSNEKKAIERVIFRIDAGGHRVPHDQIISNYREGLKNLEKYLTYFDKARIYHNAPSREMIRPKLFYKLVKGIIVEVKQPVPKWARHLPVKMPPPAIKNEIKPSTRLKR